MMREKNLRIDIVRGIVAYILIVLSSMPCEVFGAEDGIDVKVNGRGAVIMDAARGDILYAKNPQAKFPPASTAKVMTCILAIEKLGLDDDVVPGKDVIHVEPTIIGLKVGVRYKVRDLISAMLIKSANDAAFAIAEAISGDERSFAGLMNEKAREIGMTNTNFIKASGLPTGRKDAQYTTAEDLAAMMRYAIRYPEILENMSRKEAYISGSDGRKIHLKTHNKSLFKGSTAPWGKTGYTREARRTFVGVNPDMSPSIVFSLLKSREIWDDIAELNEKGMQLLEASRRTVIDKVLDWVRAQREKGRKKTEGAIPPVM
ncbi:MAG: serine hydrolase [Candidatus Omnitrophica bacterium]|nr:serine hydrolase [Candidatus Omnitrophota bacterium]MDD5487505.1 serine hydrolase [Candidatus Omnitrophota bacterium]